MLVYVCYSHDGELDHTTICKVVDSQEKAQAWADAAYDEEAYNMTYDYEPHSVQ